MSDYSHVPKVETEDDVFTQGLVIMSKEGLGEYKIGYVSNSDYNIRVGLYQQSTTLHFVFASNESINDANIYLVSPASTTLFDIRSISNEYESGYYADDSYTIVPDYTACTVFSDKNSVLAVMIMPAPSIDSGVVVTANASPVYNPPASNGIIVNATARLLNVYAQGSESGPNSGTGVYNNPDDVIDGPGLPEIGIADGTLISMFNPNQSELRGLGDYLFDTSIWTAAIKELFGNPLDYILSLGIVPIKPCVTQEKVAFSLGPSPFSNLSMYQITRQFDEVDCGFVRVPEYWGGFLDYEPYTSIQIYLPYIGYREISPSEVLNKDLHVYYHIDLFTGSCICFIQVDDKILYQFEGNCLVQLPLTATAHSQIMSGIISAIGFGATAIATKGLGLFGGAGDFMAWGSGASAIASATNAAKTNVLHGGNISSAYGLMAVQVPYLILRRPRQAVAKEQNHYSGYSTWERVSDFLFVTGFTKVAEIHLEGLAATDWEIQEIERLLKNGVIF